MDSMLKKVNTLNRWSKLFSDHKMVMTRECKKLELDLFQEIALNEHRMHIQLLTLFFQIFQRSDLPNVKLITHLTIEHQIINN